MKLIIRVSYDIDVVYFDMRIIFTMVRRTMLAQGLPADVPGRLLGYLADHVKGQGLRRRR